MEQEKTAPTWFYGMIGVAAVGGISLLLLTAIMFSNPPDRIEMTHIAPPQETQGQ